MPASPRKVALVGIAIVAYSCVAVLIAMAVSSPLPENPTCGQLRDDTTSRAAVVRLARELDPPPGVTPAEMSQAIESTLATECARYRRKTVAKAGAAPSAPTFAEPSAGGCANSRPGGADASTGRHRPRLPHSRAASEGGVTP